MKKVAIIQARMGSTRLPGKVTMMLGAKTVLEHVVARVEKSNVIDTIVVATSVLPQDDIIYDLTQKIGVACHRGSEDNVLSRYYEAAISHQADIIVRITADCPFLDPVLLESMMISFCEARNNADPIDYLSNSLERSYPRGLDIEIFTMHALTQAFHQADQDYQKEHVTPYINQHPNLFILGNYANQHNLSEHRWTLDTEEDYLFISSVYNKLCVNNDYFTTDDLLDLLQKEPWLSELNCHVKQKSVSCQGN